MNLINRTRRVLTRNGFAGLVMKVRIVLYDYYFDFRYGVDTCRQESLEHLRIESSNRRYGNRYEPSRALPMMWFFRKVQPHLPEVRMMVDMGSGKGRVLMIASLYGFDRAKGIEFAGELCEIAKDNCASFKETTGVATDFRILQGDAATYLIVPEDTVIFFFNPFMSVVMAQVLENIERSWQQYPRKMVICCYNMPSTEQLDSMQYFRRRAEYDFWGYRFQVYASPDEAAHRERAMSSAAEQQEAVDIVQAH